MPIPSVKERVRDFGTGISEPAEMTPVVFGVSSLGAPNVAEFYGSTPALRDGRGEGPAVETAAHILDQGGGPLIFIGASPSIGASNSAVTQEGPGAVVTISGDSTIDARLRLKILSSGLRGVATFAYTLDDFEGSRDQDRTYSEELTIPAGGSFVIPNVGLTVSFEEQTNSAVTQTGPGPTVTIAGTPEGIYDAIIEITTGGSVGTAVFRWSVDGGQSWTSNVLTAASVVLGTTGLTANFSAGTYEIGTTYEWVTVGFVAGSEYRADVECAAWNAADLAGGFAALSGSIPWRFFVAVTSKGNGDAASHALLAIALQTHLNSLANASKYRRGMIAAEQGPVQGQSDSPSSVVTEFASVAGIRCLIAYGAVRRSTSKPFPGYAFPVTHAVDAFAARAAESLMSTDLKRVLSGPLPALTRIFHDDYQSPTPLDNAKISTLRTWDGKDGSYITQARLKSPSGSDFKLWPHGVVMDVACEIVHAEQVDLIGAGFRYNPNGTLDERDAIRWEEVIGQALAAQLVTPRNAEGFDGHVVAVRYRLSRTQDVRSTGVILGSVGILPLGYVDFIETELGFVAVLPEAA
jgi:hypothetical protein